MALTNKEQQCIVFYLGWPSKTLDVDSTHYSKIFGDRLLNLDSDAEVKIRNILTKIENIRAQLEDAACRFTTKKVDNIELREDEMEKLCALERKCVRWLSEYLDLPVMRKGGANVCLVV